MRVKWEFCRRGECGPESGAFGGGGVVIGERLRQSYVAYILCKREEKL